MGHSSLLRPHVMAGTSEVPVEHVLIAHRERLCSQLDTMRKNNVMCDVTVMCDTTEFTAHKAILAAASAYFHNMFTEKLDRIAVPEVTPEVMELILSFVYTGHVLASVGDKEVQSVLAGAHQLRVTHLYHWCRERMVSSLSLDKLEHVWDVADLYSDPWLQSQVALYAAKNFRRLVRHSLFLQLPAERLAALVGNERLQVGSSYHDDVLAAILVWVKHDSEHRQRVIPDIIPHIKFDLMSARYVNSLDGEPTVMASLELLQALTKTMARRYQRGNDLKSDLLRAGAARSTTYSMGEDLEPQSGFASGFDNPATVSASDRATKLLAVPPNNSEALSAQLHRISAAVPLDNIHEVGGWNDHRPEFGSENRKWETDNGGRDRRDYGMGTEITTRIRGGMGSNENTILGSEIRPKGILKFRNSAHSSGEPLLVVLGQDKDDYVILQQFGLRTRRWGESYRSPVQKKYSSIIAHRGLVYIVGGKINLKPSSSMHVCDVRQRQTRQLSNMQTPRCGMGVAELDGLIYVVGGYNRSGWVHEVECFDARGDVWKRVAKLHEGKEGVGVVAANGKLYAVGGVPVPTTEMYDPMTDRWTRLTRMQHARVYHGISMLDGFVYVVGGFGHHPDRVQCLDCDSSSWSVLDSRSPQQCRDTWCAAVPFNNHLLVVNSEGLLWDFDVTSECWTKLPSSFCLVGSYISGFVSATVLDEDNR